MMSKFYKAVLVLAVFIVFSPTLSTYFSQDDWVFLSHVYKQPFSSVFKHYPESFYRPVGQQLFFFLGSQLFGLEAQGFHLMGSAIHLLNIWLLGRVMNIWSCDRRAKYFLLIFYAVNPAHFVALNWLTQMDLEIAVSLSLLTILFWKRSVLSFCFFLGALLSHEVVVMLPIAIAFWRLKGPALPRQGRALLKSIVFFSIGVLVLVTKFLANPFSSQGDYSVLLDPAAVFATVRWYLLRAMAIPEGVRNLPVWLMILSLIPGLALTLIFRQKLARGLGVYLLGVLPVLGFGSHLLAAYAVFGIVLMVIELGRVDVIPGLTRNLSKWIPAFAGMTMILLQVMVWPLLNHWSTGRGIVSRRLTQEYIFADFDGKREVLARSNDFENNPEVYFATMMGRQFEVLDGGAGRGLFGILFYRGNDLTTQFLPDAEFFKDSVLAGKFPVWNPWIFGGMPYFLDPQNFLWYPPNYIFLLMPVEAGFLVLLIGHLALAGWGVKKILGESGIAGRLGLLGAGMFMFSPKMIGHIEEGNWTLVMAASWLPALYYGLKKKSFWWVVISLAAIIINNLNIGYYSAIFVFLFYVFQKRPGLAAARPGLKMLKILFVTAILTIPRWLPLAMFGGQTVRANLAEAPLPVWSWTKIGKSLVFPLTGEHPVLQNEEILYVGLVSISLIVAYLVFKGPALPRQGRALLRFWFIWLIFIFIVALNEKTTLFSLIKWLPGFSLLRITTRAWIFMSLAAALATPIILGYIWRKSKLLAVLGVLGILAEFGVFGWGIFSRREIPKDPVPRRFYETMTSEGIPVRVYCATGCLDRPAAQRMGIALLGGNNPIQLKSFVEYLQAAGGYKETGYHPILPPYTVFNQKPQPNAELLGQTSTKFVVSEYELRDNNLKLLDQEGEFRLYRNDVKMEMKDHYFEL